MKVKWNTLNWTPTDRNNTLTPPRLQQNRQIYSSRLCTYISTSPSNRSFKFLCKCCPCGLLQSYCRNVRPYLRSRQIHCRISCHMQGKRWACPVVTTLGHMCSQLGANQRSVIRGVASAGWQQREGVLTVPDECARMMRRDEGSCQLLLSFLHLSFSLPSSPPRCCLASRRSRPECSGLPESCLQGSFSCLGWQNVRFATQEDTITDL